MCLIYLIIIIGDQVSRQGECMIFPAEYFWASELHLDTLDSETAVHVRDKYIQSLYRCTFPSDYSLCTSA